MKKPLPKVIVIVGPTASGKSAYGVMLAKKIGGEIISADSRQVYMGLDIGTGKITKREMKGIPHHMLDVANPKKVYNVEQFVKEAKIAIAKILEKKKIPIIVGGTGFYIDALIDGIVLPEVPPNKMLREKLARKSAEALFRALQKLDPTRAKTIDSKNKVRLIRAIEIAKALGKVPKAKFKKNYDAKYIGLAVDGDTLKKKITKRLNDRIKLGMIQEAKNLNKQGVTWKRMRALGLEYRYLADYLQNKITKKEMVEELSKAIWQYAKRQMTWFKKNTQIKWVIPK
jgi:tRNA dimethylallyltransferase